MSRFSTPEAYTPRNLADKILTTRAALEGERKQVTVLFADMKSSMELLANRDPEEARKILDPVIDLMMQAVHEYEGTVNQVLGDGIMALFGAPIAHEKHAVRACYAALRMHELVSRRAEELRRSSGVGVEIRIGLNSGAVVVRTIHNDLRMDYSAVGQTTHLAARLEQLAEPGTILAAKETIKLAAGYVRASSLGRLAIKGLADPIEIFAVEGSGTARTLLDSQATRQFTPFVGREHELVQLESLLGAVAQGRGQVVGMIGEAGVGKSRLVDEFTTTRIPAGWLVLHTAAVSYGRITAYQPLVDLLRGYFGLHATDQRHEVEAVVRARLVALDPGLVSIIPALVALLQSGSENPEWRALDRRQRRQQTLDAVRWLIVRESERQPTCLVIEDLHWSDSETQAFLDNLVDSLPVARILLLTNYRLEFQHGWGSKACYSQIRIDGLGPVSADQVLSALVGDGEDLAALKRMLIERTDGNPFFLEESVQTLVETGVLAGERGEYRLARPVRGLGVPSTVQAVLAARIDRLDTDDKWVVQCAAVIGERIPVDLLGAVAGFSSGVVTESVVRLRHAEFLYQTRLSAEAEYVFKHVLTRQVAYDSLLHEHRRLLHGRVVDYIERHHADRLVEHVERLADHARHAERWEAAARYLRQAGAKAFAHSANREAVAWFGQALEVLPQVPEIAATRGAAIDIHLGIRNALTLLGEHERTLEHLVQAAQIAQETGDAERLGRVLSFTANALLLLGRHHEAIETGGRARDMAARLGDVALLTATDLYIGRAHLFIGNFAEATAVFQRVVTALSGGRLHDHLGLPVLPAVFARSHLVECLVEVGRFAESERYVAEAIALAETSGHPDTVWWAHHAAGVHHLAVGDVDAAIAGFERAYDVCRTHDMPAYSPRISAELGFALALGRRGAQAMPMLRRAAAEAEARKQVVSHSQVLLWLGEVCLLEGALAEAGTAAVSALERFQRQGERGHEATTLRLLGDIAARRSPADAGQARAHYAASRQLAESLGMTPLVARCDRALAALTPAAPPEPPAS